ncbi:MAG: GNAT family N-acetyltransferase [Candidatus Gottesmanbacteria bacterium]|nr:GNAT family N-acetyltransferase [Candidatus Gottesmanbacteria bacterium]
MKIHPSHFMVHTYNVLPTTLSAQVEVIDKESFAWAYHQTLEERLVGRDKFCSSGDSIGYVVVEEKEEVIGAANMFARSITSDGVSMKLGGIGGLCTRKDKRKHGVGTELLNRAMQELRRNGVDIAYLCTEVEKEWMARFYEKVGFIRLAHGHTYTGKSGKRYTEFDGMIAPVCSQKIFQRISMIKQPFDIGRGNW